MTLVHYSAAPFVLDVRTYTNASYFKPDGLWVSVDGNEDGWKEWCRSEGFNLDGFAYRTEIVLAPEANILRLEFVEDIDAFTAKYALGDYKVDWPRVAREYQGIIIAPYQWQRRLASHASWYYTWDCASGCIWDLSVVRAVVEEPK